MLVHALGSSTIKKKHGRAKTIVLLRENRTREHVFRQAEGGRESREGRESRVGRVEMVERVERVERVETVEKVEIFERGGR